MLDGLAQGVSRNLSVAFVSPRFHCQRRNVERRRSCRRSLKQPVTNSAHPWTQITIRVPCQRRAHALHQLVGGQLSDHWSSNPIEQIQRTSRKERGSELEIGRIVCYHVARWNYAETAEFDAIEALPRNEEAIAIIVHKGILEMFPPSQDSIVCVCMYVCALYGVCVCVCVRACVSSRVSSSIRSCFV